MTVSGIIVLLTIGIAIAAFWPKVKELNVRYPGRVWPVGIIVVILALANASVREALWTTGAPAVHSWTTGAKTFNVTIKSTDEFVIGTVDGGNWDVDVSNVPYTCSTSADSGYYSGDTAAARRTCPSDIDCPAPNLYLSSLLITTGNDKSGYVGPGQMIALRNGDVLKGVLNHHRRCTLYTPINVRVTLTKH